MTLGGFLFLDTVGKRRNTTQGIKYGVKKPPAVSLTAAQLSVAVSSRRWYRCLGQN